MQANEILQTLTHLESERTNVERQWDLIESYVMPSRGKFFTEEDGEWTVDFRHRERFDDTAVFAAQSLAATIHATLTNQASSWFSMRFRDIKLNENNAYVEWLQQCVDHVHNVILTSNFHLEASEFYHDDVGFGSAFLMHEVTETGKHKFKTAMLRECYFEEDAEGNLMLFLRKRKYTARQLVDMFPNDKLDDSIMTEYAKPTGKLFTLILCVYKNPEGKADDGSPIDKHEDRLFLRKYVIQESQQEVGKVHGYYSMPVYLLRWARTAGSVWGYSQSMVAMGNILTLQEMVSMTLAAAEKQIDPPVLATSRGVLGDIDLAARGITYVESLDSVKEFMSGARVDLGNIQIDQLQSAIRYAFFQDKLELKMSPAMTATEVNARMEQMQRFLGGAVIRAKTDFLDPLIERIFMEETRGGRMPARPAGLKDDKGVDIVYIGALARLQRLDAVDAYRNFTALLFDWSRISPDVNDVFDYHEAAIDAGERLGVPGRSMRTLDEAREEKGKREGMGNEMAMAKAGKDNASAANQEAQALKAMQAVMGGAGGQA